MHFGDRETDEQTDSTDALSRSRCRERRLNNRDLEILVIGHGSLFKLVPFENLGVVSHSPPIVTMAVSLTVYEIFSVKE